MRPSRVGLLTKAWLTRHPAKTYSLTNQMCSLRVGNPSPETIIKIGSDSVR